MFSCYLEQMQNVLPFQIDELLNCLFVYAIFTRILLTLRKTLYSESNEWLFPDTASPYWVVE
jgi:hypothetical protein